MKVAFFSKYSALGPSSRFRVFQFQQPLRNAGLSTEVYPLFEDRYFEILRSAHPGRLKAQYVLSRFQLRRRLLRSSNANLFVIEQQLFPYLPFLLERQFLPSPFLVEFDDAIYLTHPRKFPRILSAASAVIAGNASLQKFALQHNKNVHIVPTVLDIQLFSPRPKTDHDVVRIGWSGLEYNFKYLRRLLPVFKSLLNKFPVEIVVLAVTPPTDFDIPFRFVKWDPKTETDQIGDFDIGLMPLENDEWSRGKCGLKLLQYMALGVPGVATPVGVNAEIIRNGENGYTADTLEEWERALAVLVEDAGLRRRIGIAARETVVQDYSTQVWLPRLIQLYERYASVQVARAPLA